VDTYTQGELVQIKLAAVPSDLDQFIMKRVFRVSMDTAF
jgi:hypothetical protein